MVRIFQMSTVLASDCPLWSIAYGPGRLRKISFENSPERRDYQVPTRSRGFYNKTYFPFRKLRWERSRLSLIEGTVLAILYGSYINIY